MSDKNSSIVDLSSIIEWYKLNCDGDWEQTYGVMLQTLDNPGWMLSVDLKNTGVDFAPEVLLMEGCDEQRHPQEDSWIDCQIDELGYRGASDINQLSRLVDVFTEFISSK